MVKIPIRNRKLPNNPRVFDVTVNDEGNIIQYEMKNIRGTLVIDEDDVRRQISETLAKQINKSELPSNRIRY